ncbi:MAG: hypothetical protein JWP20_1552, partial [Roseomonas sp.]|nr:hypothetical protein [Roseomonas sp.]
MTFHLRHALLALPLAASLALPAMAQIGAPAGVARRPPPP